MIQAGRAARASQQRLYAITASPQPNGDLKFPAVLFAFGEGAAKIEWNATLVAADQAASWILYSFEHGLVLVAGPKAVGDRVVSLSFDAPDAPRLFTVERGGKTILGRHLVLVDDRLYLAIKLFIDEDSHYLAVSLETFLSRRLPPRELYREFAIDGFPGALIGNVDCAYFDPPRAGSRRLLLAESAPPHPPSSIVLPRELSFSSTDLVVLYAANREVLALTSRRMQSSVGPNGRTRFYVLDRRRRVWQRVDVPGGGSLARAFGEWLAIQVREIREQAEPSPGENERRQELSPTGPPFDWMVRGTGLYFPGLIYLYHVPTRTKIVEETGQGDTEVLWVKDGHVLYRCDRQLFEARIDGNKLVHKRKLIERDFIADVHCVFYGPASDPPPDPPWKVTRGEPDF